jgi:predicted  nucleic acid-binding Zn-ribbon protein
MPGATKEALKALPEFVYADDSALRDAFIAKADKDIADAKLALTALQKKAATATTEAKVAMDKQAVALEADLKAADKQLDSLKHATVRRWKEFEASVTAATDRLRKAIDGSAA